MKTQVRACLQAASAIGLLFILSCNSSSRKTDSAPEPETRKVSFTFEEHGNRRTDDYQWLSNPSDSAVIRHLEAENAYVDAYLAHTKPLEEKIYQELVGRLEKRPESLPYRENGYWYYARFAEGAQYPVYARKKGTLDAPEEILLDVPSLSKDYQIFLVTGADVAPNNNLYAYNIDTSGDRRSTLYVKTLPAGEPQRVVGNTSGDCAFGEVNGFVYYVLNDPTVRAYQVRRHILGTDPATDAILFTENDSTFSVGIRTSTDRKYLIIQSTSSLTTEAYLLRTDNTGNKPVLISKRSRGHDYDVQDVVDGQVYIRTNLDALNFRLVAAPVGNPGPAGWKEVLPAQTDALLENADVLKDYVVAQYRGRALNRILLKKRTDGQTRWIEFPEEAYTARYSLPTDEYALDSIRISYLSPTTPRTDYSYSLSQDSRQVIKQQVVEGGYDASQYETRRLWVKAEEGVEVPMTVVYKKSLFKKDGSNPALLYAYGSYGYSTDPVFNLNWLSLLDRGFVCGIAHVRGGQEMGRAWYDDGKLLKKKNTFTDFIACSQYLVDNRYTASDKLFAQGGSAGGMLMGVITNLRPDLYRGILAQVPWTDVITDMFNTSLPLTTLEYDEWGDPNKKEYYDYMLSWSPYDNIRDAKFPAIFATGGLNDTQVPYFSPAKWVSRLRDHNKGTNPILFKCNMGAGHGGESGRFERQKLTAQLYTFMLDQLGRNE